MRMFMLLGMMLALPATGQAEAPAPLDACGLLVPEEIESVQGESPVRSKGSQHPEDQVVRSQCFWSLPTHTRSISLEVTHGAPAAVRQRWERFFHGENGDEAPGSPGKTGAPQAVPGLGEEAFWAGNAEVGGLYVLSGGRFLRLAVGGGADDAERIQRTSSLARRILHHLEAEGTAVAGERRTP